VFGLLWESWHKCAVELAKKPDCGPSNFAMLTISSSLAFKGIKNGVFTRKPSHVQSRAAHASLHRELWIENRFIASDIHLQDPQEPLAQLTYRRRDPVEENLLLASARSRVSTHTVYQQKWKGSNLTFCILSTMNSLSPSSSSLYPLLSNLPTISPTRLC
jgi:hypothetical protein